MQGESPLQQYMALETDDERAEFLIRLCRAGKWGEYFACSANNVGWYGHAQPGKYPPRKRRKR